MSQGREPNVAFPEECRSEETQSGLPRTFESFSLSRGKVYPYKSLRTKNHDVDRKSFTPYQKLIDFVKEKNPTVFTAKSLGENNNKEKI